MTEVAMQRVSALIGLPRLLDEYGVPLSAVTEGLDLPSGCFDDPDLTIPYCDASALLSRSARLTGHCHFGLMLGLRYDHRVQGPAGRIMMAAQTLEGALTAFVALQPAVTSGGVIYLHRYGNDVILGYGTVQRYPWLETKQLACVLGVYLNSIRRLTGGQAQPLEIVFAFRPPEHAWIWEGLLDAPVRFNQPENGIILPRSAMALPILPAERQFADDPGTIPDLSHVAAMTPPMSMTMQVSRAIRAGILSGEVTADETARRLGMHGKAMARRLAAEGTSFRVLLDDVRSTLARHLLSVTDLSIGEVALSLGYANHPAFVAAFRRWVGASPSDWRSRPAARD
jgi:AraC-like DNA-binding protein